LEELERICKAVKIPVIAIGGINLDNVDQVMKAGAHGIAVISAVVDSANPKESVKKLMKKVGPTGFEPATSRL
jgi:Thiamine monophosphate synthase